MVSCVLKMHRASQLQRLKQLQLARLQMRLPLYTLAAGLEEGFGSFCGAGCATSCWSGAQPLQGHVADRQNKETQ